MNVERLTPNAERRSSDGVMAQKPYDLEDRLLEYAAAVIRVSEGLRKSSAAAHIGNQLLRSGTSPFLNHGEAESAESRSDFIHKLRICLKELRESRRALRLILRVPLCDDRSLVDVLMKESDELIRIFVASVRTAQKGLARERGDAIYDTATAGDASAFDVGSSAFSVSLEGSDA